MLKKVLAVTGVMAALLFNGCLLGPDEENNGVNFENIAVSNSVVSGGGFVNITGKMSADTAFTYVLTVKDHNSKFEISYTQISSKNVDLASKEVAAKIKALSTATAGTYQLVITATCRDEVTTTTRDFTVTGGSTGTLVTEATIAVAGHGNDTIGSSMNLDNGLVLKAGAATAAGSGVDLLYTFSNTLNKPVLMTPVYAKNSSGIVAFANWVSPNDTKFHKVTANYASITTKEQIVALYNASANFTGRVECAAGDVFVVKTDLGAYALVKMESVTTTNKGIASIKFAK